MPPSTRASAAAAAAVLVLAATVALLATSASAARAHGETARLDPTCTAALGALYTEHYAPVPPSPVSPCQLMIEQALKTKLNERCPDADALAACFAAAPAGAWSSFVHRCALFSTAPADPAAVAAVAAAAPSPPPIAAASAEATPADAAAGRRLLADEGEGEGEGEGGSTGAGQGCFPNFKTAADFDAWLAGDFVETKDYGRASPIALASVAVFTVLLLSMAAV